LRRRSSQSAGVFATALAGKNAKEYESGQTIVSQGEECSDVYYIEKGMVKLTLVSNRGKGAVLGILGPGDFFGEACIGGDAVFSTSAIALLPSVIDVFRRKAMLKMVEENPSLSAHFINYLLTRNRRIEQDLIDHMFNFSEKRLARVLLLLARGGKNGEVAPILEKIGQDTLAEMVGTTRSRVNFFMNKFRKQGLFTITAG
jgi:CRP/FNR family transcriptional regulator, cyclic AMP receptor protein